MHSSSKGHLESRYLGSSTNSTADSVDHIIKKYARPRPESCTYSNKNKYNRRSFRTLKNYNYNNCIDHKQNINECNGLNNNLYNLITSYCREEIHKEVRSKFSEKNLQNSFDSNEHHPELSSQREYSDKATYCRPILNLYNQEFIYQTIEKNARLTRLVKKLIAAHHREIQNEAWNNFINELKNKHAHNKRRRPKLDINAKPVERDIFQNDDHFSELIDDCCDTKYLFQHSNLCKSLLEDIYKDLYQSKVEQKCNRELNANIYRRNTFCYPTSSLSRLIMLQKEKERIAHIHAFETLSANNITKEQKNATYTQEKTIDESFSFYDCESNLSKHFVNTIIRTELDEFPLIDSMKKKEELKLTEVKQELKKTDSKNSNISKQSVAQSQNKYEHSLKHVEHKLEIIIDLINNFIKELKPKKISRSNHHNTCINRICKECHNLRNKLVKKYNEDLYGEEYNCSDSDLLLNDINASFELVGNNNSDITKLNEISTTELGSVKNNNSYKTCAVQITFEVPTRERSTEVTKSLSQTWKHLEDNVEEVIVPDTNRNEQLTIAVNTDPLSFLALLRISTEAMKRFLSYMPSFHYYDYLSGLQFPQLPKTTDRKFVCNICGAKFKKPSHLNNHIRDHDLGQAKSCCLCRHVLGNLRRTSGLFSCRYCGQCFTRAYCCELHQETCAKRLGKHDVESVLLLS